MGGKNTVENYMNKNNGTDAGCQDQMKSKENMKNGLKTVVTADALPAVGFFLDVFVLPPTISLLAHVLLCL